MIIFVLISIFFGLIGSLSIPLTKYIAHIEDSLVCDVCNNRINCFAQKPFGRRSNWVSEFMLLSYCKVRRTCEYYCSNTYSITILYIIVNLVLGMIPFWSKGITMTGILCCITTSALLALSVVDWKTQYIPFEYTMIIFMCGLIHLCADLSDWLEYVIGLIAVSGFLFIVNLIATPILRKRYEGVQEIDGAIGDGDIKLMAATGLLLGWKLNFLAIGIGCIIGSIIHLTLMKIKGSERQFALGPYLSLGVYITMICGEQLVSWYLNMVGVTPL